MSAKKQVFHSQSRTRWRIFQGGIFLLLVGILSIPILLYFGFQNKIIPDLPLLLSSEEKSTILTNPTKIPDLNAHEK